VTSPQSNRADPALLEQLRGHARHSADLELWVGDGWLPLVAKCHGRLENRFPDYELLAVKEKFGELAFQAFPRPWRQGGAWTDGEATEADEITDDVRRRSVEVCERCGQPGELRLERANVLTLCDTHDASTPDLPVGSMRRRFRGA
jgi:hypothetical protein